MPRHRFFLLLSALGRHPLHLCAPGLYHTIIAAMAVCGAARLQHRSTGPHLATQQQCGGLSCRPAWWPPDPWSIPPYKRGGGGGYRGRGGGGGGGGGEGQRQGEGGKEGGGEEGGGGGRGEGVGGGGGGGASSTPCARDRAILPAAGAGGQADITIEKVMTTRGAANRDGRSMPTTTAR